jgi:hypothetical protein
MPCLKDYEVAFIDVPRIVNGKIVLARIYKDEFIKMRVAGWSTAEIMEGVRTHHATAQACKPEEPASTH